MKKIIAFGLACVLAAASQAAYDDSLLMFQTVGPDKYADGTTVLNGECYALVWTKTGTTFAGLDANGNPLNETDRLIIAAPVAKDGHCPPVTYQVPAEIVTELAGKGSWGVYLLDTRVQTNGKVAPKGAPAGKLALVNGYGAVATATLASGTAGAAVQTEGEGKVVTTGVSAPKDVPQPKIKAIAIEGDNVKLTVQNLPGFMRVQSGATVKANEVQGAAQATDGNAAQDVIFYMPKAKAAQGFFRVTRGQ